MPFAVSSSLEVHDVKGRKVRGREYPWGIIETENPVSCYNLSKMKY